MTLAVQGCPHGHDILRVPRAAQKLETENNFFSSLHNSFVKTLLHLSMIIFLKMIKKDVRSEYTSKSLRKCYNTFKTAVRIEHDNKIALLILRRYICAVKSSTHCARSSSEIDMGQCNFFGINF